MEENEVLKNVTPTSKQHFTEPPARYTEARLIKDLEEKSIGRPSTYATIIDTLQKRGYASLEKASETSKTKVFIPSEQGILTNEKLQQYFSSVINVEYTADMEKLWMKLPKETRTLYLTCTNSMINLLHL